MIDKNSQFMAILTNVGAAKLANANALGIPWKLTAMAVGDANGTDPVPSATQTKLINEVRRAPLNQLKPDPKNSAVIIAEQIIPESAGGFWVREIGLYDQDGDLVAVANCPATFKPTVSQGAGRTQVIRMNLIVSSTVNIELKIDPSVVLATREYVDLAILEVLPPTRKAGTYRQVVIDKRGVVVSGTNPTTMDGYGITDGFASSIVAANYNQVDKTALYSLGAGSTPGRPAGFSGSGALHQVVGDYAFTLAWNLAGDGLAFQRQDSAGVKAWCYAWHSSNFDPALKANLKSPAFTDLPTAPTAAAGTNSTQLANCAFTGAAISNYALTVSTALAGKADKATTLPGYGITPATPADVAAGQDNTKPVTAAGLASIDPWALQPIGKWIAISTELSSSLAPPTNKAYRYISLTANDSYNAGVLNNEVVVGSFPLVDATATVSLADSPLVGKRLHLINTEHRVLRGSPSSGQILQDALQNITGGLSVVSVNGATGAFTFTTEGSASVFNGGNNRGSVQFDASRVVRTDTETRVKSLGVTYYMRVK